MSISRPIQWYHSLADPIWPDGTLPLLIYHFYDCSAVISTSVAPVTQGSVECSSVPLIDNHHGGNVQILAPALGFLAKVNYV
jgi:hypothetical protein